MAAPKNWEKIDEEPYDLWEYQGPGAFEEAPLVLVTESETYWLAKFNYVDAREKTVIIYGDTNRERVRRVAVRFMTAHPVLDSDFEHALDYIRHEI